MPEKSAHTNGWQIGEVIFGVPFLVGIGLNIILSAALSPSGFQPAGIAIGILLVIAGFRLIAAARRELARFQQPTDPGQPTTGLVTTGVFGITRNPLYLAAVCVFAGIAIALNNVWAAGATFVGTVLCHYVLIAPEERYLAEKFGEAYAKYAARVNRWVGKV
jgi:protein-S-isoprenylcysteine O-methyltransferase Ste14